MPLDQTISAAVSYSGASTVLMGSGNYYDLAHPETSVVTIEDVAYGLAFKSRFSGQTVSQVLRRRVFYSVAEHCVRGSRVIAQELARDFLLHELNEVIWADFLTPQKAMIPDAVKHADQSGAALARQFGVKMLDKQEVKRIDLIMLATERRDLMPPTEEAWKILEGIEPLPERIVPYQHPEMAAEAFLRRVKELDIVGR
jgi:hypothetical protein